MIPISKELFKSGDKILFHTKGFSPISLGIRTLTQSFWNHVGGYVEEVDLKGYVIEALGRGVVKTPIEKYLNNKSYILKVVRLRSGAFKDAEEHKQGLEVARQRLYGKVGLKYDWWAIVWLGAKYLAKSYYRKGRKYIPLGNPLQSREKFFCSELICEADYKISSLYPYLYQGKTKQDCSSTTPKDIKKAETIEYIAGVDKN